MKLTSIFLVILVLFLLFFMACPSNLSQNNQGDNTNNKEDNEEDNITNILYVHPINGDNNNLGTKESPLKTIQAAIDKASSSYSEASIYVAEGVYEKNYAEDKEPVITLKADISLYGGYSSTDWDERNPSLYQTVIRDTSTTEGSLSDPNRAIYSNNEVTNTTVLDGFEIEGGSGDVTFAIFNEGGSPIIQNNHISSGNGVNAAGIYNYDHASPIIRYNSITGEDTTSFAIYNYSSSSPSIYCNTILGGEAGIQSIAIYNDTDTNTHIYNNILDGGNASLSIGIFNAETNTVYIRNNTINGGSDGTVYNMGIASLTAHVVIENNIIFNYNTINMGYGYYEFDTSASPLSFCNNNFSNCLTAIYYDADTNQELTVIEDVNNYLNTTQTTSDSSQNNTALEPIFIDIDGTDNDIVTLFDNDWQLDNSSPLEIIQGGINGAHSSYNWNFNFDMNNQTRSPQDDSSLTGWSMGAYELNVASLAATSTTKSTSTLRQKSTTTHPPQLVDKEKIINIRLSK